MHLETPATPQTAKLSFSIFCEAQLASLEAEKIGCSTACHQNCSEVNQKQELETVTYTHLIQQNLQNNQRSVYQ